LERHGMQGTSHLPPSFRHGRGPCALAH
jgi:hypothetical protein